METQLIAKPQPTLPHLNMTGIPKAEVPTGIAPPVTGADSQCQCADCEKNDCGPNN